MATRGSYVRNSAVKFWGGIRKCWFYAIFSKYWWFETKRFTGLLELVQLYKTKPIRENSHFHYLPKPYIGFNFSDMWPLTFIFLVGHWGDDDWETRSQSSDAASYRGGPKKPRVRNLPVSIVFTL